jgi:DNA topoisomerase II
LLVYTCFQVNLCFFVLPVPTSNLSLLLHLAMETERMAVEAEEVSQKVPPKRGKKAAITKHSDDDMDELSGDDFEMKEKKVRGRGRGKQPPKEKAAPGPRKRGPAAQKKPLLGQKLITEVLKPDGEGNNSPDKKVRKIRPSPFNKKSGSVGKDDNSGGTSASSLMDDILQEEVGVVASRDRPKRERKVARVFIESDSEEVDDSNDEDFGSDFDEDDD